MCFGRVSLGAAFFHGRAADFQRGLIFGVAPWGETPQLGDENVIAQWQPRMVFCGWETLGSSLAPHLIGNMNTHSSLAPS